MSVGDANAGRVGPWLGVNKPGFFVAVEDIDAEGRPLINFQVFGGLTDEAATALLRWIVSALDD